MPANAPTVSVALATYNGATYIAEQVLSILGQTTPAAQLVVADDGSADDTVAIVERLVREHGDGAPELVVLRGDRPSGVSANFERAIASAGGDFIALCDQDDVWHPAKLQTMLAALQASPGALLAHSDARLVDERGAALDSTLFQRLEIGPDDLRELREGDAFGTLLRRNLVTGATVVFRRELATLAAPIPSAWVHDEWLAIIAAATGGIVPLTEPLIDYRQHGSNQIGVREPTLRAKIDRVFSPRGDRNHGLAERSALLRDALLRLGDRVAAEDVARATEKAEFERIRAELPEGRFRRAWPVLRLATTGDYGHYASQGTADVLRDLLQPA